jgi:hypothetical protein
VDQEQNTKLLSEYQPRIVRFGDRIIVRGKNVAIGWGAKIIDEGNDPWLQYTFKYDKTQTIISGDKVDTQTFQLGQVTGLFPSQPYYLTGDVIYAAEYLY